jgi:phage anti-repressor protein
MNLVPVYQNKEGTLVVNARELQDFLENSKDFSNWIKDQIENCDLEEGFEYFLYQGEALKTLQEILENKAQPAEEGKQLALSGRGGHNRKDYLLTLDAAKEIAMINKGPRSKEIRKYFIACEKELRKKQQDDFDRFNRLSESEKLRENARLALKLADEMEQHQALKDRKNRGVLFDALNRVTDERPVISIKRIREEYFLGFSDHAVQTFLRYVNHPKRIEKVKNIPKEMYIDENLFEAAQQLWDECEKVPRPKLLELTHSCFLNRLVYMEYDIAE